MAGRVLRVTCLGALSTLLCLVPAPAGAQDRPPILPRLSFDVSTATVDEAATSVSFRVSLSRLSDREVTATYTTRDGSATAGSDFTARSGTVRIAAQQPGATITVTLRNDELDEPAEAFSLRLSSPGNASLYPLKTGSTTLSARRTIIDDDRGFLTFQSGAGSQQSVNSYLLSLASHYVYRGNVGATTEGGFRDAFKQRFRQWGATGFTFVSATGPFVDTQVATMSIGNAFIVVFRGTEMDRIADLLDDALAVHVPLGIGVNVHAGFAGALAPLYGQLKALAEQARRDGKRVWLTGHSLGGALATIAAYRLENDGVAVQGISTYGSPRVGDLGFAGAFNSLFGSRSQRWVNDRDFGPLLPPVPLILPNPIPLAPPLTYLYVHVLQTNNIVPGTSGFNLRLNDSERILIIGDPADHDTRRYSRRIRPHLSESSRNEVPLAP